MKCLCCAKPITNASSEEERTSWHTRCVKRFFGTNTLPKIDLNEETLEKMANEIASKGLTVAGVQKKLSLHLFSENNKPRLTLVNYPTGYILKPQVSQFESLPEAEQLVMSMAETVGIMTVPHALISKNSSYAYITKRVDRIITDTAVKMLAMEDFCQLDFRLTQDKYKGSYERCAKIIERYSCRKGLDLTELFLRLVFSFVVGNSDMHLKNFSLLETSEGSEMYQLSPAYDLLPVNVILPEDQEECALALNGKKMNLRKKDFLVFADNCGLSRTSAEKMIQMVISKKGKFYKMCEESLLSEVMKDQFKALIEKRLEILE